MGIDQTRADKPSAKINLFPAAITRTDSGNPIPAEGDITRVNLLGQNIYHTQVAQHQIGWPGSAGHSQQPFHFHGSSTRTGLVFITIKTSDGLSADREKIIPQSLPRTSPRERKRVGQLCPTL
jgi:hypothetical protein